MQNMFIFHRFTGQESESDSVPESISGNVNEPSVWTHSKAAIDSDEKFYLCRNLDLWPQTAAAVSDDDVRPTENTRQVLQVRSYKQVQRTSLLRPVNGFPGFPLDLENLEKWEYTWKTWKYHEILKKMLWNLEKLGGY